MAPLADLYDSLPIQAEKQIRLVSFQYPNSTGPIELKLEVAPKLENADFVALSYTWQWPYGDPSEDADGYNTRSESIKCNGCDFEITKNLSEFLCAVRAHKELRQKMFWIDALCINQARDDDTGEKKEQVQIMAKIYGQASSVVVWLGQENKDAVPAITLIDKLCHLTEDEREEVTPTTLQAATKLSPEYQTPEAWKPLARFFCRRYFRRAWVVQEIISAESKHLSVLCGTQRVSWRNLQVTSHFITNSSWSRLFSSPGFTDIDGGMQPHHGGPATLAETIAAKMKKSEAVFTYSLIRSREYECTRPKDKIYSLIGLRYLQNSAVPFTIQVNYKQTDCEIYAETALRILDSTNDLLLLYYAEGDDYRHIEGLPSWAPDWSVGKVVVLGIVGYERYWADNEKQPHLQIHRGVSSPQMATLELKAWDFDTISAVGETEEEVYHGKPCARWLKIVQSCLGRHYRHYGQDQQTKEVFWRTLLTNTDRGQSNNEPERSMENAFAHWIARNCRGTPHQDSEEIETGLDCLRQWGLPIPSGEIDRNEVDRFASLYRHTNCLRLFRTRKGLLGLGTTSLQVGDSISIVPGSRVPLIFRTAMFASPTFTHKSSWLSWLSFLTNIPSSESQDRLLLCNSLGNKPFVHFDGYDEAVHLVGACYLHGVMKGEATKELRDGDLSTLMII